MFGAHESESQGVFVWNRCLLKMHISWSHSRSIESEYLGARPPKLHFDKHLDDSDSHEAFVFNLSNHPKVSIIFLVCQPIGILACNYEFFRTLFKSHLLQKAFSNSPRKMFFIFFTFLLLIVKTPLIRLICYVSGPGTTLKKA